MPIHLFTFVAIASSALVLGLFVQQNTRAQSPPDSETQSSSNNNAYQSQFVFPLSTQHNHAPGIVQFSNGDLLVSWYRGAGERKADDVVVMGAWKRAGHDRWSDPFVMADEPGFPDCNTCMHVDKEGRLWLFWPTVIANSWESCLTRCQVSNQPTDGSGPIWDRQGLVLLRPDDFADEAKAIFDQLIANQFTEPPSPAIVQEIETAKDRLSDKLFQRLGWQPRCKPTVLPSGRILLPLYTDTFSISIMAISDNGGKSWYASKPLYGLGNIQPSVLRRDDGTLVAYMRNNGPGERMLVSQSIDDGITWTIAQLADIPNSGSGLDAVRLDNGNWVLVCNDTVRGRSRLTLMLSNDEGKTWKWSRSLEDHTSGQYHYPVIIQGHDDQIHVVYSYFVEAGKTMKYVRVKESWIKGGD